MIITFGSINVDFVYVDRCGADMLAKRQSEQYSRAAGYGFRRK